MPDLLQDRVREIMDCYLAEQERHEAAKAQIAADKDFALSKARTVVQHEQSHIENLQQAAQAERQRVIQEASDRLQKRVMTARQRLGSRLSAASARRKDLDILRQKMPKEFADTKAAPMESVVLPNSDNVYLDLLNTMYAYENASLLRRPDMKVRANKAAAQFNAMMQAELLNIEKAERAAKDDLDLNAMQLQHDEELEYELSKIDMHQDDSVDRSGLIEAERQAEKVCQQRIADEESRHAAQPTFEQVRAACLQEVKNERERLGIGEEVLAREYQPASQLSQDPALFNIVLDAGRFDVELPYLTSWDHPEHLWFYVDDEEVQEEVLDGFRSLVCENLRLQPFGQLRIFWLDPSQQGISIRELAAFVDDLPVCGPLIKRATTGSQVSQLLAELEGLQAEIGEKIAPYRGGIREYNEKNPADKIPYTLVIVNDITHPSYESRAIDAIAQRLRNASRMGMQFLVLSDAYEIGSREDRALDEAREQFFRTVAEVQGGSLFTQQDDGALAQVRVLGPEFATPAFIQSYLDACEEMARRPAEQQAVQPQVDLDEAPVFSAKEGIEIPIGFYEDGTVASLKFGSVVGGPYAEHTHGIITGGTGSGKTTFVRNLIQSACSHYSPRELELWLVDYKAEMTSFCNLHYRFPHFGLIGLDKSMDFVSGFMDALKKEYERRSFIISEPSMKGELKRDDISDYNEWAEANERETLPRLLIIIDEFHVQAGYMKQNPEWRQTFENLLREVRSRGMNILLVDQDISGLSAGLTESGQAQLSFRATLGINAGRTQDLRALFGSADNFSDTVSMAASMRHQALLHEKATNSVRLVAQMRDCDWNSIARAVSCAEEKSPGQRIDTKIYNVHDIEGLPLDKIVPSETGLFPIGTIPDFVKPSFELQLRNRSRQNVFAMGASEPLLPFNVISLMAYTAWKHYGYRVVLLGNEESDIFDETLDAWEELNEEYMNNEVLICETVREVNRFFDDVDALEHAFVVIVGFDDLYAEMAELPPRPIRTSQKNSSHEAPVSNRMRLAALFGGVDLDDAGDQENDNVLPSSDEEFNDTANLYQLLTASKEKDVRVAVLDDSFPELRKMFRGERRTDFDKLFPHSLGTKPAIISASDFAQAARYVARSMDDGEIDSKIIYADPSNKIKTIAVYDVPWNESLKG